MGFISKIFYFFTAYTDGRERAVGTFLKGLTERSNQKRTRARLGILLQRDIAVINLWTEYKYKGYKYLRKSERKKLHANLQLIAIDFDQFYRKRTRNEAAVARIRQIAPQAQVDPEKVGLLRALTDYFSPARGVYEYRSSSSFGRLLRDPSREKLVGDCNQIVTLYIYLYSRYEDVRDLQVRVLPEHVALHYDGVDIETTSGTFADYSQRKGNRLLPVEEIVSINLLDSTDSYLSTHEIAPEDFLQAARFAFILSHDRIVVTHDLKAAYSAKVNALMKRNNFVQALKFAAASRDRELLNVVGHNGAVYEMQRHNYAAARRFAGHAIKREELIRNCWQAAGSDHYQTHRYHDAIKAFKHSGDRKLIGQCYEALFFEQQQKLGANLTNETIKKHSRTVKRMRGYAKKSGSKRLIDQASTLNKYM